MNETSFARMFLSASRRVEENHLYRTFETIRHNDPSDPHATGLLRNFRDETLAAGHSLSFVASEDMHLFLFPMVGSLMLQVEGLNDELIEVGETRLVFISRGNSFSIFNCHETLINYVQCCVAMPETPEAAPHLHFEMLRFDGREEINYTLHDQMNRVFVWVVQGAFEVKNRLLEQRDGMIVRGLGNIDAEALSNEAILLLVEYG